MLTDAHGRRIRKLRVSLTDKCNLRCHYCMPVDQTFMDEESYLTPQGYFEVIQQLTELGLEEVRLTGGEPLMRKSFPEILEKLSALNLKKISLTTNGIFLDRHLEVLKKCGVNHLNISVDSLNEDTFQKVTRGRHLSRILANISAAVRQGFVVKINTVAMKGVNDSEFLDFVKFSETSGVEVRFLELMRIGHALETQKAQFISAAEILQKIRVARALEPQTVAVDSTSFNFVTSNGGRIGFIASESQPFCGHCSRWRLSADGILRACLLKDEGLSVKNLAPEKRLDVYQMLLGMKPFLRPAEVAHSMNAIGG
jgi:cyclic pyranopterin phosphate synthase